MSPSPNRSFRHHLENEFRARARVNPRYSLRAFARTLGMDHSSLSRLIRGQRRLNYSTVRTLGAKLGLSDEQLAEFKEASASSPASDLSPSGADVFAETSESAVARRAASFEVVEADHFALISEWHYFAILELLGLARFRATPASVARKLGIPADDAAGALERLARLGFIERNHKGDWAVATATQSFVPLDGDLTKRAFRQLQGQLLDKAKQAVETVPVARRDQSGMTMAISRKRLPEAIERITRFRRELASFLEQDVDRDDVYQLSISLFPLTVPTEESDER